MKKILTTSAGILSLLATPAFAQSYNPPADSAYQQATTQVWTEDEADILVEMPNSFACIIANSRPDLTPVGNWEALIDEEECFGEVEAEDGQGTNAVNYARVKINSSRASNNDPQIVNAFFDSIDGRRYIARITLREGPTDANPLGDWYFAFYNAGDEDSALTPTTTTNYGFVDIDTSGDDVTIASADVFGSDGTASIIKYDGDTVTFGGIIAESGDFPVNAFFAGKMNDEYYYRTRFSAVGFDAADTLADVQSGDTVGVATSLAALRPESGTGQCFNFDNEWETVNRYGVYDADGDAVELSGGFSFETDQDSPVYGYMGNWGVWLDTESNLFTPTDNSIDINANVANSDTPVSRTLEWAGGELFQISSASAALSDGDVMIAYTSSGPVRAVWNDTDGNFDLSELDDPDTAASPSVLSTRSNLYFPKLQQNVEWDGNSPSVTYLLEESVATNETVLESGLILRNYSEYVPNEVSNLPITVSEYGSNGMVNIASGTTTQSAQTFVLTPRTISEFEGRTLYFDTNNNGSVDAGEEPVRFNFTLAYTESGQSATPYGGSASSYSGYYPYESVMLHADTPECAVVDSADCDKYVWRYGASIWDHSVAAFDTDGPITISKPLRFDYTHAAASDLNNGNTLTFSSPDPNNPAAHTETSGAYSVTGATYANQTFMLEYDGSNLHGLPWAPVGSDAYAQWVALANLVDGTELETSEGTNYYVHALEIARTLKAESSTTPCENAGVYFETINPLSSDVQLGLSLSDIPNITDTDSYPRPSAVWSGAPDDDDLTCTVTHGDGSACVSE